MFNLPQEQKSTRLGNIDRIRDLLFGQQIEEYTQHFENYERRLKQIESDLDNFQRQMREQLNKMQNSLSEEINSAVDNLEKKLHYLSLNSQEKINQLNKDTKIVEQKNSQDLDKLKQNLSEKSLIIDDRSKKNFERIEEDIQGLRYQIFEEIEKNFANLKENKLTRTELSELFFSICLNIKANNLTGKLSEINSEKSIQPEILPPE
jgi:DNA anti-recombination protein RmuC